MQTCAEDSIQIGTTGKFPDRLMRPSAFEITVQAKSCLAHCCGSCETSPCRRSGMMLHPTGLSVEFLSVLRARASLMAATKKNPPVQLPKDVLPPMPLASCLSERMKCFPALARDITVCKFCYYKAQSVDSQIKCAINRSRSLVEIKPVVRLDCWLLDGTEVATAAGALRIHWTSS
jgi:hypothetical protein